MLDSHTARFSVVGTAGVVTAMCIFERDHLALRIRSAADGLAFAAVGYSLAKRLCLLLGGIPAEVSTNGAEQSLSALLEKYASIITTANQDKMQQAQPQALDLVDFAMVQGGALWSALK
ncbi:hypothetical protein GGF44_000508 [Coemansia sp. RSA 1694]|nr:hypothetical protein GGF44_000508 [Coemansia sp. RSA 1694]